MELRVRQRLGIEGARPVVDGAPEILRVGRIDEAHLECPWSFSVLAKRFQVPP